MHNSRIEDASLKPERQLWDSFDGSEDGDGRSSNSANAARRTDPKKGNGMIQWPLLLGCCRCKGLMYAPLAHPNGPPAGAWWWTQRRMTRRRAMLSCTLLALVILGACAAGIAVQVLNLINNLRFRLDHVSVQGLDKCGGPVTVDLLFHVSNPSGVRMRMTNLQAKLFAGSLNSSKAGMGDAPDSAPKPESLDLVEVSLGPDGATIDSQLLQNVSVRLHAVLTNSFKANLLVQTDPGAGPIVKDLEIDSPLANLGATIRADVEVWLMGDMRLAIPSWTWGTVSLGDFLDVGPGPANFKEKPADFKESIPEENSGEKFDVSNSQVGVDVSDSSQVDKRLCWFTNFEGELCTLGDTGSWVEPPSGANFDLTQKVAASLNFSLSEQAQRLLDARVPILRVALGRWDLAADGEQKSKDDRGGGESGPLEFHLDPGTSSAQSPPGHTTSSDSGSPGLAGGGPADQRREGRVKMLLQGAGAADLVKSLTQQEAPHSKLEENWRLWFVRGPQAPATLTNKADSEGGSEAACGLQNWLQDVTVSANLSDIRAAMLYFAAVAAGIDSDIDFSPAALAKKLSTSYEGYSDNGKDTILVRASFLNPLDSPISVGIVTPTVSIGVSESPTSSSPSFASLSCKSTSSHVLPGSRLTLTLTLSIRDAKRLGAAISPLMHGGTLQPWITGVSVVSNGGAITVEEVQLFLDSLLVGSRLPALSTGSPFILRDVVGFLDQASVERGGDLSSLRLRLRREISVPGATLFFRASIPTISIVITRKRLSSGGTAATTAMSRTRISLFVSFLSVSVEADTTFYNVSSPSCNPLLSSLFLRSSLEASMHLDIGSVATLPIPLEIPASFVDGKPVWAPGSIVGANAQADVALPCSVRQGLATGTLCNDVATTISYTPVSLTTSLAYGGSTVASRWSWPIADGSWNSSLRDASAACQPVEANLEMFPAGAASPEEETVCGRAVLESGTDASASRWSIAAPMELVVKNICTCLHGVGQCTGPRIGSGPGQLPAVLAAGWLPPWSAGPQTSESSWKCQAHGLNVTLCSS